MNNYDGPLKIRPRAIRTRYIVLLLMPAKEIKKYHGTD